MSSTTIHIINHPSVFQRSKIVLHEGLRPRCWVLRLEGNRYIVSLEYVSLRTVSVGGKNNRQEITFVEHSMFDKETSFKFGDIDQDRVRKTAQKEFRERSHML